MAGKKNMILADTGFWVAFFNAKDKFHQQSVAVMSQLDESLITTWPVITETCYLLGNYLGVQSQLRFVKVLEQDYIHVFDMQFKHLPRIQQLMQKYADLPMDLADASLVLLAEELGHGRILSTDQRDFRAYRWKNRHPFENLLLR
jgi:predicted nucleic acid-binding protein